MQFWNPQPSTNEEDMRWSWLRATEWGNWPRFVSQVVVPVLLLWWPAWQAIVAVVLATWLWWPICGRIVNASVAGLGAYLVVSLKWPLSIGMGIYFAFHRQYQTAGISALWPVIVMLLCFVTPPVRVGTLQNVFLRQMGYVSKSDR
jgi:hypothetical protein